MGAPRPARPWLLTGGPSLVFRCKDAAIGAFDTFAPPPPRFAQRSCGCDEAVARVLRARGAKNNHPFFTCRAARSRRPIFEVEEKPCVPSGAA